MEWIRFAAWLFFNVAVPLLAPIALLPLLSMSRTHQGKPRSLIRRAVQDGQLFWTVIALCAAACYEVAGLLSKLGGKAGHEGEELLAWLAVSLLIIMIIGSSALVLLGTLDAVNHTLPRHGNRLSVIMRTSIWMAALAAIGFSIIHYWTN